MEELQPTKKKKELESRAPLEGRAQLEESAHQDLKLGPELEVYRNVLFDAIFNTGISYCAALLTDQLDINLFCGQIGEIQPVILDKNTEKNSFFLQFIDFENDEQEITSVVVKKENLLPLFSFDPTQDEKIKTTVKKQIQDEILTLKEIRDIWEEKKFNKISTDTLELHRKAESRFEIGQLATVQVDVEQKLFHSTNEKFTIQAGQTGIISNMSNTDIDYVEITFWSLPLGTLALERKQLVTKNQNLGSVAGSFNPQSIGYSGWKKTIRIHKDYVFPLYCEALDYTH